jgi:hypothetical protein
MYMYVMYIEMRGAPQVVVTDVIVQTTDDLFCRFSRNVRVPKKYSQCFSSMTMI